MSPLRLQSPDLDAPALRFLQRCHALARQGATPVAALDSPEQARAQADHLLWQLAAQPARARQAHGELDSEQVARWLQA